MTNVTTTIEHESTAEQPRALETIIAVTKAVYSPDTHPAPVEPVATVESICNGVTAIEHLTAAQQLTKTLTNNPTDPDFAPEDTISPEAVAKAHVSYAQDALHSSKSKITRLLREDARKQDKLTGDCQSARDLLGESCLHTDELSFALPSSSSNSWRPSLKPDEYHLPSIEVTQEIATTTAEAVAQLNLGLTEQYGYLVVAPDVSIQPVHTPEQTPFREKAKTAVSTETSVETTPIAQPDSPDGYVPTISVD